MEPNNTQRSLIGDSISFAFNGIFSNILPWIGMWLTMFGFMILGLIGLGIIIGASKVFLHIDLDLSQVVPENMSITMPEGNTSGLIWFMTAGIAYISVFVASMQLGLLRTMIQFHNSNVVKFRPVLNLRAIFTLIAATLILILLVISGLIFFIIPGIIIIFRTMFTKYLIIDKNMGPIAAIKGSWNMTRGKSGVMIGLLVISFIINFIPIIGWLMTSLMAVYIYESLSKQTA